MLPESHYNYCLFMLVKSCKDPTIQRYHFNTNDSLCRKVIIASLTAILRKTCLQGRPLVDAWELGFGKGSHHSLTGKSDSSCLNCLYKQCGLCQTPVFLLGHLKLSHILGRECLCDQAQTKILAIDSPMSAYRQHFPHVVTISGYRN